MTLVEADGETHVPRASKDVVAEAILDRVEQLRQASPAERRSELY